MTIFLIERFTPALRPEDIAAAVARLSVISQVNHLWTVLVPGEETCLTLITAPDLKTLAAANVEARFPFARIVCAVLFSTEPPNHSLKEEPPWHASDGDDRC